MASLQSVSQSAEALHNPAIATNLDALQAQLEHIIQECHELLMQVEQARLQKSP